VPSASLTIGSVKTYGWNFRRETTGMTRPLDSSTGQRAVFGFFPVGDIALDVAYGLSSKSTVAYCGLYVLEMPFRVLVTPKVPSRWTTRWIGFPSQGSVVLAQKSMGAFFVVPPRGE
jgi:hypothetical protein